MSIDVEFDMISPLFNEALDRQNWQSFIKIIKENYQNDNLVEIKPKYIVFKTGEHLLFSFDDHRFLHFSSKISGSHVKRMEEYIDTITRVAKTSFDSRVRYWNDVFE